MRWEEIFISIFFFFFFLTFIFGLFDRFLENPFSCTVEPKNAMSVRIDDATSGTSDVVSHGVAVVETRLR